MLVNVEAGREAVCGIDKKLDRSSAVTDAKYGLESADFKIFV